MKKLNALILSAVFAASAFAQPVPPTLATAPSITVQEEVELYNAISSLDKGVVKIVDGKAAQVPCVFSAATRYTLGLDASMVKLKAEAYQNAASATRARLDPKGTPDKPSENGITQAIMDEVLPVFRKVDPMPPPLQKIALADLNLDANPIPFDTLTKLRLIIQQ